MNPSHPPRPSSLAELYRALATREGLAGEPAELFVALLAHKYPLESWSFSTRQPRWWIYLLWIPGLLGVVWLNDRKFVLSHAAIAVGVTAIAAGHSVWVWRREMRDEVFGRPFALTWDDYCANKRDFLRQVIPEILREYPPVP